MTNQEREQAEVSKRERSRWEFSQQPLTAIELVMQERKRVEALRKRKDIPAMDEDQILEFQED